MRPFRLFSEERTRIRQKSLRTAQAGDVRLEQCVPYSVDLGSTRVFHILSTLLSQGLAGDGNDASNLAVEAAMKHFRGDYHAAEGKFGVLWSDVNIYISCCCC